MPSAIRITKAKTVTGLYRFKFSGRVSSESKGCSAGRNVALLNKAAYADNQWRVVWHGKSNRNGGWSTPWIATEKFPGGYGTPDPIRVVARESKKTVGGKRVVCQQAKRTYWNLSFTF